MPASWLQCFYLGAFEIGLLARLGIVRGTTFCNHHRPITASAVPLTAAVPLDRIKTDQKVQAVAQTTRKSVQGVGSSTR